MDAYSVYRDIQKANEGPVPDRSGGACTDGKVHPDPPVSGGAGTAVSFGKGTGGGTGCPAFKRGGKDDHNGGAEICAERRRGAAAWGGRSDPAATDRLRRLSGADAAGNLENEKERMVKTPWSEQAIPFREAAEIGTKKVIAEHSTIGLMVTCDGSFGELPRENFSAGGGTNRCGAQKAGKALPDSCECEKTVPGGDTAAGKGA